MSWFRSRKRAGAEVSANPASSATGRRWRLRPWFRRTLLTATAVAGFSVVVSVIGLIQVPPSRIVTRQDSMVTVREVTRLYPVTVRQVVTPHSVDEIVAAITGSTGPIAIGGGRYSMGGQTATRGGLQLDLREFRGV
ncbi:MAG TPA: hypothetical protein VG817_12915, partial [Gemmatimonadales bacterium]|nr:hypothetical protein [Gemmatimonadales bacterium]